MHQDVRDGFSFYDSLGRITKAIDYINYHDSSISRPNQIIVFDSKGDTVLSKSHFYRLYSIKDTIKLNSEKYNFKIVFGGEQFRYNYIFLGEFNDNFRLPEGKKCVFSEMKGSEIELTPQKYEVGVNFIRGYILSTSSPLDDNGNLAGEAIQTFFTDKFYVIP